MAILVDTNVLLRSLHPEHPHYSTAEKAIAELRMQGETLCIAVQNLIEFWAVATRPREDNGLGLTSGRAATEIATLRRFFRLLPSLPDTLEAWHRIVVSQNSIGKQSHDAHLVAVMQVHAVTGILTFNGGHFQRYPGITVLDPAQI